MFFKQTNKQKIVKKYPERLFKEPSKAGEEGAGAGADE